MVVDSFLEAVVGGVSQHPFNRVKKFTVEYSGGHTLILEGDVLMSFWNEIMQLYMMQKQIMSGPPPVVSEEIRQRHADMHRKNDEDDEE